ncbi:hypothetical protein ASE48_03370 [Mycobacterium sp. Root265]|uniref:CBU_0592 family membrane protein n=1 Tax=Mycobacterium sp. Root265 TaxID=1736504 RepID=UPI000711194F|nr:hypothetical protein [Mycobacterium sp. Root265]KRD14079.1 hypothetical protein ASE48_03370 [Mycobacterium sp. Root265]
MIAATLGWVGTAGTLVAYLSLSRGWLSNASRRYAALNIVGGVLGGTASALYGAWPSAASNYAWAAIGAMSVAALYRDGAARTRLPAEACAAS